MGAVSFCHLTIERPGLSFGDLIWLPQSGRSPRPAQGRCADGGQHRRIYTRQKKYHERSPWSKPLGHSSQSAKATTLRIVTLSSNARIFMFGSDLLTPAD
jgi:hypothetical protein